MKRVLVCATNGSEEVETLTIVDLLRRAGLCCRLVSTQNTGKFTGSHGVQIETDGNFKDEDLKSYDAIVIPGGLKGVENLRANIKIINALQNFNESGKLTAAICAGPTVLGKAGILHGRKATVYPGMDKELNGAVYEDSPVVRDGNIITGRALGAAIPFALSIISYLLDEKTGDKVASEIVYNHGYC